MEKKSMVRLGFDTKKVIKKYAYGDESYDQVLKRIFGLVREPVKFKLRTI